ncbi:MAG TPA: hypothetical protein VIV40_18595 [Kofleriaceae bacterium]
MRIAIVGRRITTTQGDKTMDTKQETEKKSLNINEDALKAAAGKPLFRVKAQGADVMRKILEQCCIR